MIFLFHRRAETTNQQFRDHYLTRHAPFSMSLTDKMTAYAVNLVDQANAATLPGADAPLDAVTIINTESASKFFDPLWVFASQADADAQMADHNSFIGPMYAFLTHGDPRPVQQATAARTPGAKVIVLVAEAVDSVAITSAAGVSQSMVHTIDAAIIPDGPPLAQLIELWSDDADALRSAAGDHPWLSVDEYVSRA